MRSFQVVIALAVAGLLHGRNVGASFPGNFSAVENLKVNLTAKLMPDLTMSKMMLNKTKDAVVDLKNVTDTLIRDKEAKMKKIDAAFKPDGWALPKAEPAKPKTASFARTVNDEKVEAEAQDDNTANCWDEAPKHSRQFSCEQQKEWGKCGEGWMMTEDAPKNGWCAKTCGRC